MKKTFFLLGILLNFFLLGYSQVNISVGDVHPALKADYRLSIKKNDELLLVYKKKESCIIQKFDAKLNLNTQNVYEGFPRGFEISLATEFNGKNLLFYYYFSEENKKEKIVCYREIDFSKGQLIGEEHKLSQGPYLYYFIEVINGETLRINDDLYDKNLNLISSGRSKKIPTEQKYTILNSTCYSRQGYKYELEKLESSSKDNKKGDSFELLRYDLRSGLVGKTTINLEKKNSNSVGVRVGIDGSVFVAGFYYQTEEDAKKDDAKGIFSIKVDKDGKINKQSYFDIPQEVLNQNGGRRVGKNVEKFPGTDNLALAEFIAENDGSLTIVGEYKYRMMQMTERLSSPNPNPRNASQKSTSMSHSFHFDAIIVSKIDSSGKLSWVRKIPKSQYGAVSLGGFKLTTGPGYKYFLYFDDERNLELSSNNIPYDYNSDLYDGSFIGYKISDISGDISKMKIFNYKDVGGLEIKQFDIWSIIKSDYNVFYLKAFEKGKEDILIKVELEHTKK